jgi:hypothetical protein
MSCSKRCGPRRTERGQTVVLNFTWTTPKVLQAANGSLHYQLQLYRQVGNRISYDITIKPPEKMVVTQPLSSLFKTPAKAAPGSAAEFAIPVLLKDAQLMLSFTGRYLEKPIGRQIGVIARLCSSRQRQCHER